MAQASSNFNSAFDPFGIGDAPSAGDGAPSEGGLSTERFDAFGEGDFEEDATTPLASGDKGPNPNKLVQVGFPWLATTAERRSLLGVVLHLQALLHPRFTHACLGLMTL